MMSSGSLTHRATLDGSTEGITCIDFNQTVKAAPEPELETLVLYLALSDVVSVDPLQGLRILAASYDKSALLWQRDESVPKVTVTNRSQTP